MASGFPFRVQKHPDALTEFLAFESLAAEIGCRPPAILQSHPADLVKKGESAADGENTRLCHATGDGERPVVQVRGRHDMVHQSVNHGFGSPENASSKAQLNRPPLSHSRRYRPENEE